MQWMPLAERFIIYMAQSGILQAILLGTTLLLEIIVPLAELFLIMAQSGILQAILLGTTRLLLEIIVPLAERFLMNMAQSGI